MTAANWTNQQVIDQLNSGEKWTGSTITYAFPTLASGMFSQGEATGFKAATASQQVWLKLALQSWDELIPQSFAQVSSGSNIELAYTTTNISYAHAYHPTIGSVWFNAGHTSLTSTTVGSYGYMAAMHEIGHAMGLEHMGNYNGGGSWTPSSYQDSAVFSIMSYFGPQGAAPLYSAEVMQADWTAANGVTYSAQTPMLHDIMAIQAMYGVSTTTRLGDTVYGFGSNVSGTAREIYDFSFNQNPILTIFDSGGTDTLNLAGWSSNSTVYLQSGKYSSCNNMSNNIAIAYGCVIENATTGNGNDFLQGNDVANRLEAGGGNDRLEGGGGNDWLYGGAGIDTALVTGYYAQYSFTYDPETQGFSMQGGNTGLDWLFGFEYVQFGDALKTVQDLLASSGSGSSGSTDTFAPTLLSSSPADNGSDVAVGSNIVLTFSEAVVAGNGLIRVHKADGSVAMSIAANDASQVAISGSTVTINPANDLLGGQSYYVTVEQGALRDLSGNGFAGIADAATLNFSTKSTTTTVSSVDDYANSTATTGVVLVNGAASSGAINYTDDVDVFKVALTAGKTYVFDLQRSGDAGLSNPYLELYSPYLSFVAYNDDGGGNGNARITVKVSLTGNYYLAAWDAGAGTGHYTLKAALADLVAPTLTLASPNNGRTDVATNSNITLTFSEAIKAGSGQIQIFKLSGELVHSINISDSSQVSISGSTLTINPVQDLDASTVYYVKMASGVVKDLAGNNYAGLNTTTALKFTTGLKTIEGTAGDDTLNGGAQNEKLLGQNGNDTLDGGAGADVLIGGSGHDRYFVDNIGDKVQETSSVAGEIDSVFSSVNFTLGANLENLTLLGSASLSGTGNALANTLTGNAGNNILNGGNGNDVLDGGAGADTLNGGYGADTYHVDHVLDRIVEIGTDIDTVHASVDYTLAAGVERLLLTGSAALTGRGNTLNNVLQGNDGNNILIGGGGADQLQGGLGADAFVFLAYAELGLGSRRDVILDFNAAEGDRIDLSALDAVPATTTVNNAFTFIGGNAFSGNATGQVRFADGVLQISNDADLAAEYEIQLLGVTTLDVSALLL
ncbi:Ig-like domain-containing protein [Chitinilyticum litopenaei]|uniref:Ig-like domain-containing protein n=1 Tax=Chitinilyticum litopenaei TaxID=1121276 RepID=UPI000401F520|nr:Ig-like domain-containing protein [Chitinilyticum litopenaei]